MQQISSKKFIKFLNRHGCVYIRTKGSHDIYDTKPPLLRPIVLRGNEKDVPLTHLKTNLKTLGVSWEAFLKEINEI